MVSVIVPVYNVCEYLDKCIESIVNQTYADLEIILINDGSTDGSDKKCEEWAGRDSRIRYVSKKNEGLGPTRNLGVQMASAEYIMFVDSDDWIDNRIVEKLYYKLLETDSDIAVCDRYEVKLSDESHTLVTNELSEEVVEVKDMPSILTVITTSACAKLYKKSLYTENHVEQPAHFYEDVTTLLLLVLSKRVCYVREALYYYVIDRNGSITNGISGLYHLVDYMETLVELFTQYGLFERYSIQIMEICQKRVYWNLYHVSKILNREANRIYQQNVEFLNKYFGEGNTDNPDILLDLESLFCGWGSYNLMVSMKMLMSMRTDKPPSDYFCFSSLISAMDIKGNLNEINVEHKNIFRKNQLLKELKREFANKNLGELSEVNYLIIDFLEERFDIGRYRGRYLTLSDAFVDLKQNNEISYKCYDRNKFSTELLWKRSCRKFISLIRKYMKEKVIVLVKMKLAEDYGSMDHRKKFDDLSEIQKTNQRLESYYAFFQKNCPEARVVEVADSDLYYTDEDFKHGCYPWHLNNYMYLEIKDRIKEIIWGKKQITGLGFCLGQETKEKKLQK